MIMLGANPQVRVDTAMLVLRHSF